MTITLLKNFTFVLSDTDTLTTDWVPFPAEYRNALLHAHLQALDPVAPSTGLVITLQTSFDTVEDPTIGSNIVMAATGSQNQRHTDDLLGLVRIVLSNGDTATLSGTVTVTLQPKSE